jgi:hypothetical protein
MKRYGGVEVRLHTLVPSIIFMSLLLCPVEEAHRTHLLGYLMGPIARLDALEKRKVF